MGMAAYCFLKGVPDQALVSPIEESESRGELSFISLAEPGPRGSNPSQSAELTSPRLILPNRDTYCWPTCLRAGWHQPGLRLR